MEVIGQPPKLAGQPCEALICEGFVHAGELVASANVVHLRFAGCWHKLIIDGGVIIWRLSEKTPAPWEIERSDFQYPHTNVGALACVIGHRLERYLMEQSPSGVTVMFSFDNGRSVVIDNENDRSTFQII